MKPDDLAARLRTVFLGELEEQVQVMNLDLLAFEKEPGNAERLKSLFRVAHTLKGSARAAAVPLIEQVCHGLESLLAKARDGKLELGPDHFSLLYSAADALDDAGRRLRAGQDFVGSPLAALNETLTGTLPARAAPSHDPTIIRKAEGQVRVDARKLDGLLVTARQLLMARSQVADLTAEIEALHGFASRCAKDWRHGGPNVQLALDRSGAPPGTVQALSGVEQSFRRLVRESERLATAAVGQTRTLHAASEDLTHQVRQLRMRPFSEICDALPRAVRDLAAASGKEVQLELIGGEVEADRTVLDGLREALLHLVRNAVDHGIEGPDTRERLGKPRQGTVSIAAALHGDRIVVTVSDDGVGLNLVAIRAQMQKRAIAIPAQDRELARALFQGGLSTRAEATAISGRGVGLDLVRAALAGVRGAVDVTWEDGRGTRFVLECPPTLASIRALLVGAGAQTLAVPTTYVERLLRVAPGQIKRIEGRDVLAGLDAPVPLVALGRLFSLAPGETGGGPVPVMLLRADGRRLAVAVDELIAEEEIVLQPLSRGRQQLALLSGAVLLGTGRVALVLDVAAVVAAGLDLEAGGLTMAEGPHPRPVKHRILVVDDSITTRILEQSILEAAGYDVLTAVDGADGWRLLQERGADLVVADVEMPRMDGFALCEAIRSSKRFKELPLVLVTALETPEDRAHGLEAGADAYLGKSSFDQQGLLDSIRQLLG